MVSRVNLIGATIAHYRVTRLFGQGPLGTVHVSENLAAGPPVTVKILRPDPPGGLRRTARIRADTALAASLTHPNVARVFLTGEYKRLPFVASEYDPQATSLRQLLRPGPVALGAEPSPRGEAPIGRTLPFAEALRIARDIAEGLAAAHAAGLRHGSLKPENILLGPGLRGRIGDFGWSGYEASLGAQWRCSCGTGDSTETELPLAGPGPGETGYCPPEQLRGDAVGPCGDIFAFRVILHEVLTGRAPFASHASTDSFERVLLRPPDELPRADGMSTAMAGLIRRCLEKDPLARYPSARELADDLAVIEAGGVPAPRAANAESTVSYGPLPRWRLGIQRPRTLLVLLASLAAAGVAAGLAFQRAIPPAGFPLRAAVIPLTAPGDPALAAAADLTEAMADYLGQVRGLRVSVRESAADVIRQADG
jgi:serine/threonine protein kinase